MKPEEWVTNALDAAADQVGETAITDPVVLETIAAVVAAVRELHSEQRLDR